MATLVVSLKKVLESVLRKELPSFDLEREMLYFQTWPIHSRFFISLAFPSQCMLRIFGQLKVFCRAMASSLQIFFAVDSSSV